MPQKQRAPGNTKAVAPPKNNQDMYRLSYVTFEGGRFDADIVVNSLKAIEGWIKYQGIDTYVIQKNGKLYKVASMGFVKSYKD